MSENHLGDTPALSQQSPRERLNSKIEAVREAEMAELRERLPRVLEELAQATVEAQAANARRERLVREARESQDILGGFSFHDRIMTWNELQDYNLELSRDDRYDEEDQIVFGRSPASHEAALATKEEAHDGD